MAPQIGIDFEFGSRRAPADRLVYSTEGGRIIRLNGAVCMQLRAARVSHLVFGDRRHC